VKNSNNFSLKRLVLKVEALQVLDPEPRLGGAIGVKACRIAAIA
jgi:hypothetical protein